MCVTQTVNPFLHLIGKDTYNAENFCTGISQYLNDFQYGPAGGDQVFHDYDLLSGFKMTLNLILTAVILRTGTDIAHRKIEKVRGDSGMRYSCSACAH